MQQVADAFAGTIAERPEDWHVLGRIWPEVGPDGRPGTAPEAGSDTTPGTGGAARPEPAEAG